MKSEEGLSIVPDQTIDEIDIDEFDSLLLPGAADIRLAVEDERILEFIRKLGARRSERYRLPLFCL